MEDKKIAEIEESPAARVKWLAEQMRFRLKEALAQRGSSEAFLHWMQSEANKTA